MSVTAKVQVTNRTVQGDGQVSLSFNAPYQDKNGKRINEEWAQYTPALSLSMTVKGDVADQPEFQMGAVALLTFEVEDQTADADEDPADGGVQESLPAGTYEDDEAAADEQPADPREANGQPGDEADDERQYSA